MEIREFLKENKLIFDGSMGTYFAGKYRDYENPCELANLEKSLYVREIHREYIEAGCNAIKTNTFSVNPLNSMFSGDRLADTIQAACRLAQEAVAAAEYPEKSEYSAAATPEGRAPHRPHYIFADIGPMTAPDEAQTLEGYLKVCDIFIACGITNFLFETLSNADALTDIAKYIKKKVPDAFIITSFAVQPDGYTREGLYYQELLEKMQNCTAVDAVGLNCVSGASHMKELLENINLQEKYLSVMPNAGYPRVVGNRVFYDSDPVYFADRVMEMSELGATILGGCCGTSPAFIKQISEKVQISQNQLPKKIAVRTEGSNHPSSNVDVSAAEKSKSKISAKPISDSISSDPENHFWSKLEAGKKVIAVELDPPRKADGTKFMSGAWALKAAGVDAITIADCATARASMDSSIMACKIRRELGIDTIPHMTCRDRNLNATKALLLGLNMEGVKNVLVVTGDPIPTAERDEVKSVYQFNSRMLARYIRSLNQNELEKPFRVYGALNVNSKKFDLQLKIAKEKVENGVSCFLTQPVLTEKAAENLRLAYKELGKSGMGAKILGGIIPVVSSRNARFMNSEISGITVDENIASLYEGKTREECTQLAIDLSTKLARMIAPYCDGYYLMTPFSRTDIITAIIENLRKED